MTHGFRLLGIAALATLIAAPASAEYFPPDGTGWWQLQTLDTFEQVCASGAGPCDPEPGTYRLIDFGTSPATRSLVTIDAEDDRGDGERRAPRLFVTTVGGVGSSGSEGATQASVTCPAGTTVVGGSCSARALSDGGPIIPAFGGLVDVDDRSEYACRTDDPAFVIVAEATCY